MPPKRAQLTTPPSANTIFLACGIAAGSYFLTRTPSALPEFYNPWLYYGFFALITLIPLTLGGIRLWNEFSAPERGEIFLRILLVLCITVLAGIVCQWYNPSYQALKACVVILLTVFGMKIVSL